MILKIMLNLFLLGTLLFANDAEIEETFEKYNLDGTLVIASLNNEEKYIYNDKRAHKRFTPASTFKIPHTLIVLNEKIVNSQDDIIAWDNVKRVYEVWNQDQTLKSAFLVSCVWCYQKFTTHLSKEKYLEYLKQFNYGNATIGSNISEFWLDGSLKISAYEQIDFLKKIYNHSLLADEKSMLIVQNILVEEENEHYILRAKSGWNGTIGWYVGYITTKEKSYFFAMNGNIKKEQLHLRKELVLKALKVKKIIK
ncbi:MAG: class D beta-lactamase [Arcobacteraceae bacterium]